MKTKFGLEKDRHSYVLLFCAIMYKEGAETPPIEALLEKECGEILWKSEPLDFSIFTRYYKAEMGNNLKKYIVSFKELKPIENLHLIKRKTVEIEMSLAKNKKRLFNLDPGYLSLGKTNMFTTKDFSHRTYIKDGIFGEVNLMFSKENEIYEPCFGTYPDFQTELFRSFLTKNRIYYENTLKSQKNQ